MNVYGLGGEGGKEGSPIFTDHVEQTLQFASQILSSLNLQPTNLHVTFSLLLVYCQTRNWATASLMLYIEKQVLCLRRLCMRCIFARFTQPNLRPLVQSCTASELEVMTRRAGGQAVISDGGSGGKVERGGASEPITQIALKGAHVNRVFLLCHFKP